MGGGRLRELDCKGKIFKSTYKEWSGIFILKK